MYRVSMYISTDKKKVIYLTRIVAIIFKWLTLIINYVLFFPLNWSITYIREFI